MFIVELSFTVRIGDKKQAIRIVNYVLLFPH